MAKIEKILKFICDELIYGGHLLAFGGIAIVVFSTILLNIKITWDSLLVIYLIIYIVYFYNRLKELDIDYLTNFERTLHIKKYSNQAPAIFFFIILFIMGFSLYFSKNIWALIFGLFLLLLGWFYTLFFKKFTKKIIIFKNLSVSGVFSLLVFFPIVYYSSAIYNLSIVFLLLIFIYFKVFIMQIFFDIKDIKSDKEQKLLTFPVVFGKEKILNMLKIMSILVTASIPIIFSLYFHILPLSTLMLLWTIPFNFYCFEKAKNETYYPYILESGEFILWPILVLIGEIII